MIVDELRKDYFFRQLLTASNPKVFRMPFRVFPQLELVHRRSQVSLNWPGFDRMDLVPMKGEALDASFWKPPFTDMLIASETPEQGALWVISVDRKHDELREFRTDQGQTVQASWAALLGLVGISPIDGHPFPVLAIRVWSNGETLFSAADHLDRVDSTVKFAKMIGFVEPGPMLHAYRQRLIENWTREAQFESTAVSFRHVVQVFATTCALLCCKNIVQSVHNTPREQNVGRVRKGLLPLVSYHTLRLRLPGHRSAPGKPAGGGVPLAQHWVRGHFKTFTEEKPLMGKATGTFWWGPHVAGKADRTVEKDYSVEVE